MNSRLPSFILILFHLAGSYNFTQLVKLPAFISHYNDTKASDKDLNAFEFMIMHYVTTDNNSMDDAEDKKLPYKSGDDCNLKHVSQIEMLFLHSIELPLPNEKNIVLANLYIYETRSGINTSIWNPPKL